MNLEYGDIIFVKSLTTNLTLSEKFTSWAIKKITHSNYFHVCYYVRDNTVFEAQGFREAGYANLSNYVYDVKRLNFPSETRQKIMNQIISTEGSRYDYGEILSLLLRKQFGLKVFYDDKRRFICSEEIFNACQNVLGIDIVPQGTGDVSPEDIWESKYLVDVATGGQTS